MTTIYFINSYAWLKLIYDRQLYGIVGTYLQYTKYLIK